MLIPLHSARASKPFAPFALALVPGHASPLIRSLHTSPACALAVSASRPLQATQRKEMLLPGIIGASLLAAGLAARIWSTSRGPTLRPSLGPRQGKWIRGGFQSKMDKKEAAVILGLREGSLTKAKIKDAHRRMMIANHPDRGGSPYLASSTCVSIYSPMPACPWLCYPKAFLNTAFVVQALMLIPTHLLVLRTEINEAKDLLDRNTPR